MKIGQGGDDNGIAVGQGVRHGQPRSGQRYAGGAKIVQIMLFNSCNPLGRMGINLVTRERLHLDFALC